jgi:hypothetical protein
MEENDVSAFIDQLKSKITKRKDEAIAYLIFLPRTIPKTFQIDMSNKP